MRRRWSSDGEEGGLTMAKNTIVAAAVMCLWLMKQD